MPVRNWRFFPLGLVGLLACSVSLFCLQQLRSSAQYLIAQPSIKLKPSAMGTVSTPPLRLVLVKFPVGLDTQIWGSKAQPGDRAALLKAIDYSLRYLQTAKAVEEYQKYPIIGISRERVQQSLKRFRELVATNQSPLRLQKAVEQEFAFYQAIGKDGQGTAAFTGYFEPVHKASRIPTATFRYPLFRLPSNFATWPKPHPTRSQLEGADGLQYSSNQLNQLELVWLADRLEAFLVQVQGSARLQLTDGTMMTVGYAGATDYPYTGIGRELVKDGKLKLEDLTLPAVVQYFQQNPQDLNVYLPRNQRFVFFKETGGSPALGRLNVPVTPERSIATDKVLFPEGALALIQT
jgi:membrane-bound lytic murein transglycosylase A